MNKVSLLALALAIAVLPGCRDKKKESTAQVNKKSGSSKYVRTSMDADDAQVEDFDDSEGMDDLSDFDLDDEDIDIDALLKEIEEDKDTEEEASPEEEEYVEEDIEELPEEEEFAWIDEQADDELRKLYFSFNHYGIRADQKDALAYDIEQVKHMVAQAGSTTPTIVIEGHACQEGARSYNIGLSEKRAKVVADLFVAAGINKNLIKVIGRGQECPLLVDGKVINGSREDRAPNRRVEVRVIYT